MKPNFNKDNISITITPSSGLPIVLSSDDPAIRGIINLYPDPISSMKISPQLNQDITPSARAYADTTRFTANGNNDWYQTSVFMDLPISLPVGLTQIEITNGLGSSHSATLDIIEGIGQPNTFSTDSSAVDLDKAMFDSLARISHKTFNLQSEILPSAVELLFEYPADMPERIRDKIFVVNPLGERKNLHWSNVGVNLKILITESKGGVIDNINDYKFYITGTASNYLTFVSLQGFDIDGYPISGITHTLTSSL